MSNSVPVLGEGLSPEARAVVEYMWSLRGSISMAPPSLAEAAAWRAQLNAAFRPAPEVFESYGNDKLTTEISGVPVFELTPKSCRSRDQAVLYFHGGGYTIGEAEDGLAHGLARACGLRVYASSYRKAPEHPFPAPLDDALSVYRALVQRHGAQNLVLSGCSAGGGLAFATVLRARDEGLPLPAGLAGVTPWVDLTKSSDSILHTSPGLEPLGSYDMAGLGEAAASYANGRDLREPLISPLYADYSQGFCPVLLTTGTRDWFLSGCAMLQRTLKRAKIPVEMQVWEGLGHAFEVQPIPEAFEAHGYLADFITRCLGIDAATQRSA